MSDLAYVAAMVLALVLGWAGLVKLRSTTTTAATFEGLGLAAPRALARAVPLVELALAAGLVVAPSWAAPPALALVVAFSVVLARAVRAGATVGCGCFGSARHDPVSWVELVRNGFLATAAVAALWAPGPSVPSVEAVVAGSTAALTAAVVVALADLGRRTGHLFSVDTTTGVAR